MSTLSTYTLTPRSTHRTDSPWEKSLGYTRSLRRGPFIYVSGTTALRPPASGSPQWAIPAAPLHLHPTHHQALLCLETSLSAIQALGGTKRDIVRIRIYVRDRDAESVDAAARALKEFMASAPAPAAAVGEGGEDAHRDGDGNGDGWTATMVTGVGFVDAEMRVEVEVDAVVG